MFNSVKRAVRWTLGNLSSQLNMSTGDDHAWATLLASVEEWCSVELQSCRGSFPVVNGVGDNRSGLVVEQDGNKGDVGEGDLKVQRCA